MSKVSCFENCNDVKYSIIIPHYGIPELLVRCLRSIPESGEIQVIVIDDNSPNATHYELTYSELQRKNVEFYISPINGGAGHARNIGLQYATGKWVLFADADDFFMENFTDLLSQQFNSPHDIVYFNVKSVCSDDIRKESWRTKNKLFDYYSKTGDETPFRYKYCEPWGKMYKRTFLKENRIFFDETRVSNDYYFSVKSGCLANSIGIVDSPLYVVTLRENSLSYHFADSIDKILIRLDVATRVQLLMEKYGFANVKPMRNRGLMVLLLKRHPLLFLKQLYILKRKGIDILKLIIQIFNPKYMH